MRTVLAFVVVAALAAQSRADSAKLEGGTRVAFVAEPTVTSDLLGKAFGGDFSPRDRAHPSKPIARTVSDDLTKFEVLDNSLMVAGNHYLLGKAGVRPSNGKRIMVVRVEHAGKVENLAPSGPPPPKGTLVATQIAYGWALDVVIEGDPATFTAAVAADLAGSGANLAAAIKRAKLSSRVHLIGLTAKTAGTVPIATTPESVAASYTIAKDPLPIHVEYLVVGDLAVAAIPWKPGATVAMNPNIPSECYDYKAAVERLATCEKMKQVVQPMKDAFETMWKNLETAPKEARDAMATACKAGADAIVQSLTSMGC